MKKVALALIITALAAAAWAEDPVAPSPVAAAPDAVAPVAEAETTAELPSVSWELFAFDIHTPGNGYFFSWSPAMKARSFSLVLDAGYGQAFSDDKTFLETLLYRGGLGFRTDRFSMGVDFSKNFPRLSSACYGVQTGIDGNASYSFGSGLTLSTDAFYGNFENRDVTASSFFYNRVVASGSVSNDIDKEFSWKTGISLFKDAGEEDFRWGLDGAFNLSLFNNIVSSRLSLGTVDQGDTGLAATMYHDFSYYAPGLPRDTVTGNSFAVLENKLRFFLLADILRIPFISDMLYLGLILNGGAFLDRDQLLEDAHLSYMAGVEMGLLFFKSDISISYSYCPDSGWVFKFMMKQINL